MNDILTTGEAADISGLSRTTIQRLFDAGMLQGFVLPGGCGFRRILRASLLAMMQKHDIPEQREET